MELDDAIDKVKSNFNFSTTRKLEKTTKELVDTVDQSSFPCQNFRNESVKYVNKKNDKYNSLLSVYNNSRQDSNSGCMNDIDVVVKDNIAVEDLPMCCGLADVSVIPEFDAYCIQKLLEEGATIVGKANMDALAVGPSGEFSEHGEVINPMLENRIPGGSSSGSAAAVAAGLVDAGIGTDTGGSIRKPATFCNIVGMKPTKGLIHQDGLVNLAPSLDTVGFFGQNIETVSAVFSSITGITTKSSSRIKHVEKNSKETTIGLPKPFLNTSNQKIKSRIIKIANIIGSRENINIKSIELDNTVSKSAYPFITPIEFGELLANNDFIYGNFESNSKLTKYIYDKAKTVGLNSHITQRMFPSIVANEFYSGELYSRGCHESKKYTKKIEKSFKEADLLLTPTVPVFPPRKDNNLESRSDIQSMNTRPFSLSGSPTVAVPAGTVDGLPVSAQVIAPRFEDYRALQGARLIENTVNNRFEN